MMNTLEIKVTGHSHSAQKTLHYINYGSYNNDDSKHLNQPHKNRNGITKRNYLMAGVDCHADYKRSLKDFNTYLKFKPHNKVQTLNVVLSFGRSLDWRRSEDRYEGYTLARKFVKAAFPNHQAVLAEQEDNHRRMAHIHLIINAISEKSPHRTIPGGHSSSWYKHHPNAPYEHVSYGILHLRKIGQKCIDEINHHDTGFTHHLRGLTKQNGRHQANHNLHFNFYQQYVLDSVQTVLNNIHNTKLKDLRSALQPYGIKVSIKRAGRKRRRKRGKRRRRRRYRSGGIVFRVDTKDGHIVPVKRGLKKANGVHRHYIKSSALARKNSALNYRNIKNILKENRKKLERRHLAVRSASKSNNGRASVAAAFSNNISSISQNYSQSLSLIKAMPAASNAAIILNNYKSLKQKQFKAKRYEAKRIYMILPNFKGTNTIRYARWYYDNAIPAKLTGYSDDIPIFSVNKFDRSLLHSLADPIVNGFRTGQRWILAKWHAGMNAINGWLSSHHIQMGYSTAKYADLNKGGFHWYSIVDLAKHAIRGRINGIRKAKLFSRDSSSIFNRFNYYVQPALNYIRYIKSAASSASSASSNASSIKSVALINVSQSATFAKNRAASQRSIALSSLAKSSSASAFRSWAATPSGSSYISSAASESKSRSVKSKTSSSAASGYYHRQSHSPTL